MTRSILPALALLAALSTGAQAGGVDRLYVMACGEAHAPDQSRWSPGVNVGQPIDVSNNCYLIRHSDGYMLWDTGVPDALAVAQAPAAGPIPWRRATTLVSQLAAIGVQPGEIKYIGISHTHGDHVGNVDLFTSATVLIQKAEYDWAFSSVSTPFRADHPAEKLEGDRDVFGDGSVRILSTPGHTPGHQSLLVTLPKTGVLLLSGDVAHFRNNFENRRVPGGNTDKEKSLSSMERVAGLIADYKAQFWINHDAGQTAMLRRSPDFYE